MKKFAIATIVLFSLPLVTFSSGIQASPSRLEFKTDNELPQQLVIANPASEAESFVVYAEDFPAVFTISPDSFSLAPGERKVVSVAIDIQKIKSSFHTNLAILSKPLPEKKLSVSAGAKIPVTVTFLPKRGFQATGAWPYLLALIFILPLAWVLQRKFKKI